MKLKKSLFLIILSMLLTLSGCGELPVNWKLGENIALALGTETMNERELKLMALIFKTEYEDYYASLLGADFWETEIEEGRTYEDFVKESCIFRECEALLYLQRIGESRGLFLSEYEEEDLKTEAEKIYSAMTEDEKIYTAASISDISSLLSRYYLANQTIDFLIQDQNIEVSDEKSRVSDIQVIRVASEETAKSLYDRLKKGENFLTLAKENTLDETISYSVSREDLADSVSEIVFSLKEGEISDIIFLNDSYFLIRIESTYDSLQSLNHKKNLTAELKYESWENYYKEEKETISIRRNNKLFSELRLNTSGNFPKIDFFSIIND